MGLWACAVLSRERLGESDGEDLEVILEAVKVSTCGVCNPLQGEADVYEWRLGETDGEDLEAVKVRTCAWRVQSSPGRG